MRTGWKFFKLAVVLGIGFAGFAGQGNAIVICSPTSPNKCNTPADCAGYCFARTGSTAAICDGGHCCKCIPQA